MAIIPTSEFPGQIASDPTPYPHGKARNESAVGASDGTPYTANLVNDIWGLLQALLDRAGITPSGTPDQVGASQYLDAIRAVVRRDVALREVAISVGNAESQTLAGSGDAMKCGVSDAGDLSSTAETLVLAGENGRIETSSSRRSGEKGGAGAWIARSADGSYTGTFRAGAFSPTLNLYLLAGSGQELQTSPDSINWTARTPAGSPTGEWIDALWANGLFMVASSLSDLVQTSSDGTTFVETTGTSTAGVQYVTYSPKLGLWCGVGPSGKIMTSPNGTSDWTDRTAAGGYTDDFFGVIWHEEEERFLAYGENNEIQVSTDGLTWTKLGTGLPRQSGTTDINCVIEFKGALVAQGDDADWIYVSQDGEEWQPMSRYDSLSADHKGLVNTGSSAFLVGPPTLVYEGLRVA